MPATHVDGLWDRTIEDAVEAVSKWLQMVSQLRNEP